MRDKQDIIDTWPRTKARQVIFASSHDGISYAHIIVFNPDAIHEIKANRETVRRELKKLRERLNVDYNRLMTLACKSSFYRECLEEVDRITTEKFNLEEKPPWEQNHQKKKNKDA